MNGSELGAGIVLPDSQAENYAIDEIAKNGLLNAQAARARQAYRAQTNKDFAENQIKIDPSTQYQNQIQGLAQQWYNKGVQYRRQGFDPFNADYSRPDQAQAAAEYLAEKKHIEALSELAKGVSDDYKTKSNEAQQGKLDGFDDYHNFLNNTPIQKLYEMGGINALPSLYKPLDLSEVDKSYSVKPQEKQIDREIAPGVTETTTHKYVDVPQAAGAYEQLLNNQPGALHYFSKKGIGDPRQLYTYRGRNMIRDANNPEDFGHIDEPGIYHQIATDALTDPNMIRQLPNGVKQRMIAGTQNPEPWVGGQFNVGQAANNVVPYAPHEDPEFQKFVDHKFEQQIGKERAYQNELIGGVQRKLPGVELGDQSKLDATLANLAMRKQTVAQGWRRVAIEQQNADRLRNEYQKKMGDAGTREKFITDIQNMNPDAINTLGSVIQEIPGSKLVPRNGGISVIVPTEQPNVDPKTGEVNTTIPKIVKPEEYRIDKFTGKAGRMRIMQLLNRFQTMGKEKALKTEPYSPDYNDIGTQKAPESADDL